MLKKVGKNLLEFCAGILRMPFVDFKWPVAKYERAFQKFDSFRRNDQFTDEELGELLETLGNGQPRIVALALWAAGGFFKSKVVNFSWDIKRYQPVFDKVNAIRTDLVLEDEEIADFLSAVAKTLV